MAEIEKQAVQSEALQFADKATEIGLKVAAPYPKIIKWLIVGFTTLLIITNLVWGFVYYYEIKKAYENPIEMEQVQDFPTEHQEQTYKG